MSKLHTTSKVVDVANGEKVHKLARLARLALLGGALAAAGCQTQAEGLFVAEAADVVVKMDFAHRPLPEIPLPNDLATRFDASSPTGRRINASLTAPTSFERIVRRRIDDLDGWGVYAPITVPFSGPIDTTAVIAHHHGDQLDFSDDLVYVIDVTPGSPTYGQPAPLDLGEGAFPTKLEKRDHYWKADPRRDTLSMVLEEHDEDKNGNGVLDPGEDSDLDGILDRPNYIPSETRKMSEMNLAERAEALMEFYERETNTLIIRPLVPLRERTTYAVVITRRMLDAKGKPVGSPFAFAHHLGQTDALRPLTTILPKGDQFGGLKGSDVAFAWTFTTGTMTGDLFAVREGLYGRGPQAHLADSFPPAVLELNELFDQAPQKPYETKWTISGETFSAIAKLVAQAGIVSSGGPEQKKRFERSLAYVDKHVFGTYLTPRMFPRRGKDGAILDYNEQAWPQDLTGRPAPAESEEVTFWMSTPRKEATPNGKPRGVVILGHGYTGSKTEMFGFHSFFSQMGLAVVAIDNTSHGFTVGAKDKAQLLEVFGLFGVSKLAEALMRNRSSDQDLDGEEDSGADFWTAYTFHTRDVVRQTAVDYVQLVRVLRGWDGKRLWNHDINGNGIADDIAGDLDGDGTVDVGGPDMPINMTGGSLGGIMAAVMGGLEPELDAVVPIAGGGGLIDVGVRSIQGGVKEAVTLRVMGPLYVGNKGEDGRLRIDTIVPRLNDTETQAVADVPASVVDKLAAGDGVLAINHASGRRDCALLYEDEGCAAGCEAGSGDKAACKRGCLTFRVHLASTINRAERERHTIAFYKGNPFAVGVRLEEQDRGCVLVADAPEPVHVVDRFGYDIDYHFQSAPLNFKKGEPLGPIAEGMGMHRAAPELRRFLGFAQMVLDPADPAVWATHMRAGDLIAGDGKAVDTHAIVLNTNGDMNVPVNTGAAIGRAAGLIDFKTPVDAWGGRTVHEVLIDAKVYEAVDNIPHFVDVKGNGVLFDVEDLSQSATPTAALPPRGTKLTYDMPFHEGNDGFTVPRLNPPLWTHAIGDDSTGGVSGTFFPYVEPGGKHGFWEPGAHVDFLIKRCEAKAAASGGDASACKGKTWFDHGTLIIGMMGHYLATSGKELRMDACLSDWSCADLPPPPKPR
jgi:hypothetical protein